MCKFLTGGPPKGGRSAVRSSLPVNQSLVCRYDLGSGRAVLTAGRGRVRGGQLHRVVATVDGLNGTLSLDDIETVHGSTTGTLTSLNVQSTINIGRVPSSTGSRVYVPDSTDFFLHCVSARKKVPTRGRTDRYSDIYPPRP